MRIRVICGRLFSARSFCAFRAFCGNIFSSTDFSLGGYGILPYQRHLLWDILFSHRIRRIHRTSCREEPPTDFTDLHRYLGCAVLPQNSQNLAAWVWQGCHTLLICEHPCSSVGDSSLPEGSVRSAGISFLPRMARIDTDGWGALFSHRIHRIHRIGQRGYGRDAIPS